MSKRHYFIVTSFFLLGSWTAEVFGQVECAAPGTFRGIRVDGESMAFSTSICAIVPTATDAGQGGRGRGCGGQFSRDGGVLILGGKPFLALAPELNNSRLRG